MWDGDWIPAADAGMTEGARRGEWGVARGWVRGCGSTRPAVDGGPAHHERGAGEEGEERNEECEGEEETGRGHWTGGLWG